MYDTAQRVCSSSLVAIALPPHNYREEFISRVITSHHGWWCAQPRKCANIAIVQQTDQRTFPDRHIDVAMHRFDASSLCSLFAHSRDTYIDIYDYFTCSPTSTQYCYTYFRLPSRHCYSAHLSSTHAPRERTSTRSVSRIQRLAVINGPIALEAKATIEHADNLIMACNRQRHTQQFWAGTKTHAPC